MGRGRTPGTGVKVKSGEPMRPGEEGWWCCSVETGKGYQLFKFFRGTLLRSDGRSSRGECTKTLVGRNSCTPTTRQTNPDIPTQARENEKKINTE